MPPKSAPAAPEAWNTERRTLDETTTADRVPPAEVQQDPNNTQNPVEPDHLDPTVGQEPQVPADDA